MLTFEVNPNLENEMATGLFEALWMAGSSAEGYLREELGFHSVTGIDWSGEFPDTNPNQSSAFGEYPQEQRGGLRNSVSMRVSEQDEIAVDVGFFGEDMDKLLYLEYVENSQHDMEKSNGARRPLWMTFEGDNSTEVHALMNEAIERNG